jgi:hypothetical protein
MTRSNVAWIGYTRSMRVVALVLVVAAAAAVSATPATAARDIKFGIQDDAWLEGGPGRLRDRVQTLKDLGLDIVRVTLYWNEMEPSPGDFDWRRSDRLLRALDRQGMETLVTLWGTPGWASQSGSPNSVPVRGADFRRFAQAVAERYPFVDSWLIWNEPNKAAWLRPVSPSGYVTRLLNPGYLGIKAANPLARVAGGVTAPRGGSGGMSPVGFLRGMDRAGARLDAYAHHPYPIYPGATPYSGGCGGCKTVTMATLEVLLREVGRAFPRAKVWLTEYGYQTNPPDPFGVDPAQQALFLAQASQRTYAAPKVEILIQYLFRDEPDLGRWQSGLETVRGRPKPALNATMLPLVQVSRQGTRTTLWGQVRPGSGSQLYVLQTWRNGAWVGIGGLRSTSSRGFLTRTVTAAKRTQLRLWYPARRIASPTLVLR